MKLSVVRAALLLALPVMFGITSCQKKAKGDNDNTGQPSPVEIRFKHTYTAFSDLVLGQTYSAGLGFATITEFKYYISNIQFVNSATNDTVKIPDTYFLVDHKKPESKNIQFSVPSGEYYSMSFLLGIDEAKNFNSPKTGALDPALGMYWNATDGYIMGKMEGTHDSSTAVNKAFRFHIGGVKPPYNVLSRRHFKLGGDISIAPNQKTVINIMTDAKAWLTTPNGGSFATNPIVEQPGLPAYKISQNYFKMFDFISVKFE